MEHTDSKIKKKINEKFQFSDMSIYSSFHLYMGLTKFGNSDRFLNRYSEKNEANLQNVKKYIEILKHEI